MQQFGALEKVVGKLKSGISKIESFFSNNWKESSQSSNAFKDIRKMRELHERYNLELSNLNPKNLNGKNILMVEFLSRYIVIVKNYLSFFRLTNQNIDRYEETIIKMYEAKKGPMTFGENEDDSQEAVIKKAVKGLSRAELEPIREKVFESRDDILKAIKDFHPDLFSRINSKYNLDINNNLPNLLNILYKVNKNLIVMFEEGIVKAQTKYNYYKEQANRNRVNNQEQQPQQEEQQAEDAYLSGNLNATDKKIKIKIKK